MECKRTYINLAKNPTRNIRGLNGVPAAFCDAVRVDFPTHFTLIISGKLGTDADGNIVGRTMGEQTEKTMQNIKEVLEHEGATFDDVIRTLICVTQIDDESLREIHQVRAKYFSKDKFPASTLVRVDQLVRDGGLIEIEAEAVVFK